MKKSVMRMAMVAAAGTLAICGTAAAPASKQLGAAKKTDWTKQVAVSANGSHTLGNPDASVKLTEYLSYTCPHCANFHKQSDAVLRLTVIPQGKVSVTMTNLVRNPIDMTVAMLTGCGGPKSFFARHNAFMSTQETWLAKVDTMSSTQQERWYTGSYPTRMRAIAADFGFYAKMAQFGMSRAQVDACFNDTARLDQLKAQLDEVNRLGITGTPSFTLNGKVIEAHTWPAVSTAITDALAAQTAGNI